MGDTYRAVLHGNHLEWRDKEPKELLPDRGVEVVVTILGTSESPAGTSRGAAMAAALAQLAAAGGARSFGDAAHWERGTRNRR